MILMTTNLGTRIKELRTLAGMSQEELGKRVGVQRAAINKYEKGTVENIPIKTIENIAKVFDVSPTYLVGWDHQSSNPLAVEVKVIQGVQRFYGNEGVELLECFVDLSTKGKRRALQYLQELAILYSEDLVNNNKH